MDECPEADWARLTLEAAGLTAVKETPAAFVVKHADGELHFWAMDPAMHSGVESLEKELGSFDPPPDVAQVDGVTVYQLRTSWVWTVHGLNVWVDIASGAEPSPDVIGRLVLASVEVLY
jgi:hypothetical protein